MNMHLYILKGYQNMILYSNTIEFSENGHLLNLNLACVIYTYIEPLLHSRCCAK